MSGSNGDAADEIDGGTFISYLPMMAMQRWRLLVIPLVLATLAGVAAAFLLPKIYRSTVVLLVEAPQLPEEIAGSPSADMVDQRIAKIRQQVLSRPGLIEVIQQNGLYADERSKKPLSEIIEKMRDAAVITPMSAEIQQKSGGRNSTIAFSMSFDYSDPIKAQAVAQHLTDQVLMLDSTRSAEQAANAVQFLTDQAGGLQSQIAALEAKISDIKARNGATLSSAGVTMLGGSGGYDAQIAALQRDNAMLSMQRTRDPVVSAAEMQLAAARATYSDSHPDVIAAKQRLAEAREMASRNSQGPNDTTSSQIAFNNSQIAALQAARSQDSARLSAALGAQAKAPLIVEQISQLQSRLEGLNTQYQGVANRLMTAQANVKAENEQKGERLTVIDPPVVPDEPVSPNRPKLIGAGFGAGLAIGLILMLGIELILKPVRGVETVRAIAGELPLVVIPTIKYEKKRKWTWRSPLSLLRRTSSGTGE